MLDSQQKNRLIILFIALLSFLPMGLAGWMMRHPEWIPRYAHHGQLLTPPIATTRPEWLGADAFSQANMHELHGRWVLVYWSADGRCAALCQNALHKTQQLWLMMNKDLTRVRRALLLAQPMDEPSLAALRDDTRLLRVVAPQLIERLHAHPQLSREDALLLMDPLGNLMMRYPATFDPYAVKSDLKKLLQASQIG